MKNFRFYSPPAAVALLTALLLAAWACTPESIPPPAPVPSLAAGAPQGNPEEVQDECRCEMRVQRVSGNPGSLSWTLNDWPYMWNFSGYGNNDSWSFYFNEPIANGTSLPTDWFEIPPLTEGENLCDEFRVEAYGAENLVIHVKVRCFLGGSSTPVSEINDEFTFADGIPVPGTFGAIRQFFRQYICKTRAADNPDPCKEGPTSIGAD